MADWIKSVLIVHSDMHVAKALAGLIVEGHEIYVYIAGMGARVREFLQNIGVDLVVASQELPDMTGMELFSRLSRSHPRVARVLLLAGEEDMDAEEAVKGGVIHYYMSEPVETPAFMHIINENVQRRHVLGGPRQVAPVQDESSYAPHEPGAGPAEERAGSAEGSGDLSSGTGPAASECPPGDGPGPETIMAGQDVGEEPGVLSSPPASDHDELLEAIEQAEEQAVEPTEAVDEHPGDESPGEAEVEREELLQDAADVSPRESLDFEPRQVADVPDYGVEAAPSPGVDGEESRMGPVAEPMPEWRDEQRVEEIEEFVCSTEELGGLSGKAGHVATEEPTEVSLELEVSVGAETVPREPAPPADHLAPDLDQLMEEVEPAEEAEAAPPVVSEGLLEEEAPVEIMEEQEQLIPEAEAVEEQKEPFTVATPVMEHEPLDFAEEPEEVEQAEEEAIIDAVVLEGLFEEFPEEEATAEILEVRERPLPEEEAIEEREELFSETAPVPGHEPLDLPERPQELDLVEEAEPASAPSAVFEEPSKEEEATAEIVEVREQLLLEAAAVYAGSGDRPVAPTRRELFTETAPVLDQGPLDFAQYEPRVADDADHGVEVTDEATDREVEPAPSAASESADEQAAPPGEIVQEYQKEIRELETTCHRLGLENEQLLILLDQLRVENAALLIARQNSASSPPKEDETSSREKELLEQQAASLRLEVERLQADLNEAREELDRMKTTPRVEEPSKATTEIKVPHGFEETGEQASELYRQLRQVQQANDLLVLNLRKREMELAQLSEEIERLHEQQEAARRKFERELREYQQNCVTLKKVMESQEARCRQLEMDNSELHRKLAWVQDEWKQRLGSHELDR